MIGKIILRKYSYLMGLGVQPEQEHFAIYTLVYFLETVFPALRLTQSCYLHYNINIFS